MTPKQKLKLAQLFGFMLCLFGGLWASTQLFASSLQYHRALGEPLFTTADTPIYQPWAWLLWAAELYETLPEPFNDSSMGFMGGVVLGLVWAVVLKKKFREEDPLTSHGSSRWANSHELAEADLPQRPKHARGLVLGREPNGKRLLTHRGKEHAFVFAPTRSGKGVGLVVPTLLTWTGSTVVLDIKGENWDLTAGWRSQFSHAIYFDPTTRRSARYNPLNEIRQGESEIRDTRNLVEIITDPDGEGRDDFWSRSAKKFLVGAILHVLYAEPDKSLAGVLHFLQDPRWTHEQRLQRMVQTKHLGHKPHPAVARSAKGVLNAPENTRGGVLATAESYLGLWDDPIVADVTSGPSDFRLRDLQYADNPVSLYLAIPPGDLLRVRPLIRLMLVQMGSRLTEELHQADKHQLLFLLDEFPTLGRIDWFESALAYFAGYDIRCLLIAQDLNQIVKAYGQNNAILGNCHIRIAFAPNDERTARRISELLGKQTAKKQTESFSGDRASFSLDRKSESEQEYARDLLTPAEVLQLSADKEILLLAGLPPVLADKIRYYEDPHFQRRTPGIDPNAPGRWAAHLTAPELSELGPYHDRPTMPKSLWSTDVIPFDPLAEDSPSEDNPSSAIVPETDPPSSPPPESADDPTTTASPSEEFSSEGPSVPISSSLDDADSIDSPLGSDVDDLDPNQDLDAEDIEPPDDATDDPFDPDESQEDIDAWMI